jgi:hypothetical protein
MAFDGRTNHGGIADQSPADDQSCPVAGLLALVAVVVGVLAVSRMSSMGQDTEMIYSDSLRGATASTTTTSSRAAGPALSRPWPRRW